MINQDDLNGRLTITPNEFCKIFGFGRTKTFELIRDGKLETVRIGRKTLIYVKSAIRLMSPACHANDNSPSNPSKGAN